MSFSLPVKLSLVSSFMLLALSGCSESPGFEDAAPPVVIGDGAVANLDAATDAAIADASLEAAVDPSPDAQAANDGGDAGSAQDGDGGSDADGGPLDMDADVQPGDDGATEEDDAASADDAAVPDAQLEDDATVDATVPTEPVDPGELPKGSPTAALPRQLSLGRGHACSLDPSISGLLCWGDNRAGQAQVPNLSSPTAVSAGGDATCAIDGRRIRCFGDARSGITNSPTLLGTPSLIAVGDAHACVFIENSGVRCWGNSADGRLAPPSLSGVRALGAGAKHSCALTASGVTCWGDNSQGQLNTPSLSAPTALAVGAFHNCVIDAGQVKCWGGSVPALLTEIPRVVQPRALAAGASHTCVIDHKNVRCWGDPAANVLTPPELTLPYQIAVGGSGQQGFACARHLQGVTCWGGNALKQTEYKGGSLHRLHHSESTIRAPASLIWDIIVDLDKYPQWNPYTIAMKSTLKVGDPMVMTVKMNNLLTLTQTEYIRLIEPGHKICWGIETTTPEQNSGERCQWLEPKADGTTRYITQDLIEGTLNPIVNVLFDQDVQDGFDAVAASLKKRAEALNKP